MFTWNEALSVGQNIRNIFLRRVPILAWLPTYTFSRFFQDALAGLTVGMTVIPQGIAYAVVGGLPPQYGLYSSFMGCFIYLVLGSSKDVTVGPTAIMALLSQPHVLKFGPQIAILLSFLSGCVITFMGILRLGFLVDFISMPVISGFTDAAAIIIATSQVGTLLGVSSRSDNFVNSITDLLTHIEETQFWDTVLGLISMLALIGFKYLPGKKDGNCFFKSLWVLSLARNALVVVMAMALTYILSMNDMKLFKITGNIVQGLPPFQLPPFSITTDTGYYTFVELVQELGSSLISVPLIGILESIAIAKAFAKGRTLDANQEMLAVGMCNVFGSFVSSMPVTGSFTRTAVNNASGVKTQMGGIVTGGLVLLACGALTSTFKYIPKTTLSAVIIIAMYNMLDLRIFLILWRTRKTDVIPMTVTLLSCLFIGLEYGLLFGIIANLILLLYYAARPGISIEHRVVDSRSLILVSPTQSLSFPAAEYLRERIMARCDRRSDNPPVIVDGRHVHAIDATVAKNLKLLQIDLEARNQKIVFWNWWESSQRTLTAFDPSLEAYFSTTATLSQIFSEHAAAYP